MLTHGLIVNGTVIGYDDFNHGLPDLPPSRGGSEWAYMQRVKVPFEGEPRAQAEIAAKWGVTFEQVRSVPTDGGQSGWAFTVRMP